MVQQSMGGDAANFAEVFKALSDETRLAIFSMLRRACADRCCDPASEVAQRTLSDLAKTLGVGTPTVSHHIKELRRAGLIVCERHGRNMTCRINRTVLRDICRFLRSTT
jgi:ArsR family transcriptional regulator, arsenate/arsenite/antimonite-responsive transcriptional repressor